MDKNKAAFISQVEKEGNPSFTITPSGTRPFYTPLLYIEPFDATIFGNDSSEGSVRFALTQQAQDTGQPVLSNKVTLFEDAGKKADPGIVMRIAVYKNGLPMQTITQRKNATIGFIAIAFRVRDVLQSTLGQEKKNIAYAVYDGTSTHAGDLYYTSFDKKPIGVESQSLLFFALNRPWTIVFYNTTPFSIREQYGPVVIAGIGIVTSFLLFFVIYFLATGRKRALRFAETMTQELRKSEERYKTIFSTLQDVYYEADMEGIITIVSPSIALYTGIPAEKIIGTNAKDFYASPHERDVMLKRLAEYKQVWDYPITLLGKNRKHIYTSLTARFILDEHGQPRGVSGVLRDMTKRKQDEDRITRQNINLKKAHETLAGLVKTLKDDKKKLEEAMTKDEFLSMAAHQLRTPLGIIRWDIESLLHTNAKISKTAKNTLLSIFGNTLKLIALVNDLLDVSRISQGKIKNVPQKTEVIEIVKNLTVFFKSESDKKHLTVFLKEGKDIPQLFIDPNLLRQVLQNLLSNAIRYSLEKGRVTITVRKKEKFLTISVKDTGIGIAKKDQKMVFQKFFRAHNASKLTSEGTGLGLFLVKSYIDTWGGKISLQSVLHKGTTITIAIPIKNT